MPNTTYLPSRDADLLNWANSASGFITSAPATYGLTATIATAFAAAITAYSTALAAVKPGVRSGATVATKNAEKLALIQNIRAWVKTVTATATVTDAQRKQLGLNVRSRPSPIPAPSTAPTIDLVSMVARTARIHLHDSNTTGRRGKPAGVSGAAVFTYVGATPPTDPSAWKFEGNTTRTVVDVAFPETLAAGTQVWICAFWFNAKAQSGPGSTPISAYIQFGSSMAA